MSIVIFFNHHKPIKIKKIKQLLLILCFFYYPWLNFSYGSVVSSPSIELSVSSVWEPGFMVSEFVKISLQELKLITGKRLNLAERLSFKIAKGRMKRYLKHHPDILVADYLRAEEPEDREVNFILFFLCAGILVAVALLISLMHK